MPTPEQHATLSASSAARWMNCPPSAKINAAAPETTSVYAEEGRLAHSIGELKLRKLFGDGVHKPMAASTYKKKLAELKKEPLYALEMEDCTEEYVNHVQECALRYNSPMLAFEQRVEFSEWVPEGFGTSDCIMIGGTDLHIFDYKHGKGVQVSAVDNPQMKLYALGAYKRYAMFYDLEHVYVHIIQPRAGGCSVWETTVDELLTWARESVAPAAKLAYEGGGEFKPGDWCRFCAIRATCRARAEEAQAVSELPGYGKLPPELTMTEVGNALALGAQVADWLEKLKAYACEALENGDLVPGFKLVAGRSTRGWDDQAKAFEDLRKQGIEDAVLYERKPLTVAGLEKVIGKKRFAEVAGEHVVKSPGKPTLVPDSDPREPWSRAASDFASINT